MNARQRRISDSAKSRTITPGDSVTRNGTTARVLSVGRRKLVVKRKENRKVDWRVAEVSDVLAAA